MKVLNQENYQLCISALTAVGNVKIYSNIEILKCLVKTPNQIKK